MFNGSFKIFEMRNICIYFYLTNPILFIISVFYIFPNYIQYLHSFMDLGRPEYPGLLTRSIPEYLVRYLVDTLGLLAFLH